jgi:hypothetical protein
VVVTVAMVKMIFFIAVEHKSRAVWRGLPAAVVWIQRFGFSSIGETTGQSIAGR